MVMLMPGLGNVHRALPAAHNGTSQGEFSDVAWLHLLDLLANPEKLAKFEMHQRNRSKQAKRKALSAEVPGLQTLRLHLDPA